MSILIQHFASGLYLADDGRWTKTVGKALQFDQALRAWEEVDERNLSGVRIVMWRGDDALKVLAEALCERAAASI